MGTYLLGDLVRLLVEPATELPYCDRVLIMESADSGATWTVATDPQVVSE